MFPRQPDPPVRPPVPAYLPAPVVTPRSSDTDGSGRSRGPFPVLVIVWLVLIGLRSLVGTFDRLGDHDRPPVNQVKIPRDWARSPGPVGLTGSDRWARDEVAGRTFERIGGARTGPTFTFHSDGTVDVAGGDPKPAGAGPARWKIHPSGALVVEGPGVGPSCKLLKVRASGNVYGVSVDNELQFYARSGPGAGPAQPVIPPTERRE